MTLPRKHGIDVDIKWNEMKRKAEMFKRQRTSESSKERRRIPHVSINGTMHKSCSKCGSLKSLHEFGLETRSWDGLKASCRSCEKQIKEIT